MSVANSGSVTGDVAAEPPDSPPLSASVAPPAATMIVVELTFGLPIPSVNAVFSVNVPAGTLRNATRTRGGVPYAVEVVTAVSRSPTAPKKNGPEMPGTGG